MTTAAEDLRLGLSANAAQFWLLVAVNAFVGAMVGLERTVVPLLAEREFGLSTSAAAGSFLVAFGTVKALSNLVSGRLAERFGRRRVLVAGWLVGLPVPVLIIVAPTWSWIVAANALLGVHQGLCWSMTVVMKIDLVGPRNRGLAMGLNEFAGYLAVGAVAFLSGEIASRVGLRPQPFYIGIACAATGLVLSVLFVRDTTGHVRLEGREERSGKADARAAAAHAPDPSTGWQQPMVVTSCQAGFINNLNDGLAWALLPVYFAALGQPVDRIGVLAAVYPATWGVAQIGAGALSDRWGRRGLIVFGMLLQAAALFGFARASAFRGWLLASVALGLGTALVYPTLLAAIGDATRPAKRATALGLYRFWRDAGYAVGALVAGVVADLWGAAAAIDLVAALTLLSGAVVARWMPARR